MLCSLAVSATPSRLDRLNDSYLHYVPTNTGAFKTWSSLLTVPVNTPETETLQRVNRVVNTLVLYGEDIDVWGLPSYWATPMQTLAKGAGDCEDYAITKYFTLRTVGIAPEKLRLVYARVRSGDLVQKHLVLAYYATPDKDPLILDNLLDEVKPAARRPDLQPIFSFTSQHLYPGADGNAKPGLGKIDTFSKWDGLVKRAYAEGFDGL